MFICETENMIKLSSHNRACWNADNADCRPCRPCRLCRLSVIFLLVPFQVKWLKIKSFSASYNGYERDISSISLIVDDRLWFHSVIQTGDLPSFLQILQIPMSSNVVIVVYLPKNKYSDFHVFGGSVSVRIKRRRAATWNFSQIILNEN